MKRCVACEAEKPLDEFYRHPTTKDGRQSQCKACQKARVLSAYHKSPEVWREYGTDKSRARIERRRDEAAIMTAEASVRKAVLSHVKRLKKPLLEAGTGAYGEIDTAEMRRQSPYREMMAMCESFERRAEIRGLLTKPKS